MKSFDMMNQEKQRLILEDNELLSTGTKGTVVYILQQRSTM